MAPTPRRVPPIAPHDEAAALDWDEFVSRWWQRRVVAIRGGAAPFALADAFDCAVAAGADQLRQTYDLAARRAVQFSIEGQQQTRVAPWLPVAGDRSFDGHAARIAGPLAGRRHALVISRFHSHTRAVWAAARAAFAPLWQRIGMPLSGAITTLFHGDYEATPIGVHKDRFSTLLFQLAGRKRMRFWPARPWSEPVATIADYRAYLASSFAVEVGPGDLLYWPASYYHVGESAGGVATSVNVGIPIGEHRAAHVAGELLGMIDADLPESARRSTRLRAGRAAPLVGGAITADGRLPARLPAALRSALAEVQRVTAPDALAAHTRALWRARVAAGGFEPVPPAPRRR